MRRSAFARMILLSRGDGRGGLPIRDGPRAHQSIDVADDGAVRAEASDALDGSPAPAAPTRTESWSTAWAMGRCVGARARDQDDRHQRPRSARSSWAPEHEPAAVVDRADVGAGSAVQRVEPRAARQAVVARPPSSMSLPSPPLTMSFPGPPITRSFPPPPSSVSSPPRPQITSLASVPAKMSGPGRSADRADRERLPIGREVRSLRRRQLQPREPVGGDREDVAAPAAGGEADERDLRRRPATRKGRSRRRARRQVGLAGAIGVHHPDVRAPRRRSNDRTRSACRRATTTGCRRRCRCS